MYYTHCAKNEEEESMNKNKFLYSAIIMLIAVPIFAFGQQMNDYLAKYKQALQKRKFRTAGKLAKQIANDFRNSKNEHKAKTALRYATAWQEELSCISTMFHQLCQQINLKKGIYTTVSNYRGKTYRGVVHQCRRKKLYMKFAKKKFKISLRLLNPDDFLKWQPPTGKRGKFYFAIAVLYYYNDKMQPANRFFAKAKNCGYRCSYPDMYCLQVSQPTKSQPADKPLVIGKPQIIRNAKHVLYIPAGMKLGKRYPLLIALSPSANGQTMVKHWQCVGDKFRWIIYGSNIHRNGVDMLKQINEIYDDVKKLFSKYPINRAQIAVTGFSGGGMCSHAFAFYKKKFVKAIIPNTGMMHRIYQQNQKMIKQYPRRKVVVFLASPSDFRYTHMQQDQKYLRGKGWKTKWIEFKGGHVMAPEAANLEAAQWLATHVFRNSF